MADSAPVTAPPNAFLELLRQPWVGQCVILLVTFATGAGTLALSQHFTKKPEPILAADPPRPTPIACEQQFHDLGIEAKAIKADLAALRQLADEHWPKRLLPRPAPSKTKAAVR